MYKLFHSLFNINKVNKLVCYSKNHKRRFFFFSWKTCFVCQLYFCLNDLKIMLPKFDSKTL